jgi:hypothetical protein
MQKDSYAMSSETFESLFRRALVSDGMTYIETRDALRELPGEQRAAASPRLAQAAASASWREQLTASAIHGWWAHRELYELCAEYQTKPLPGIRPLSGFTPPVRGQAIASLGPQVAPRVLEMLMLSHEYTNNAELATLFSALIELKPPLAVPAMLTLLEPSHSAAHMRGALLVLAAMGETRALDRACHLASTDNLNADLLPSRRWRVCDTRMRRAVSRPACPPLRRAHRASG